MKKHLHPKKAIMPAIFSTIVAAAEFATDPVVKAWVVAQPFKASASLLGSMLALHVAIAVVKFLRKEPPAGEDKGGGPACGG